MISYIVYKNGNKHTIIMFLSSLKNQRTFNEFFMFTLNHCRARMSLINDLSSNLILGISVFFAQINENIFFELRSIEISDTNN